MEHLFDGKPLGDCFCKPFVTLIYRHCKNASKKLVSSSLVGKDMGNNELGILRHCICRANQWAGFYDRDIRPERVAICKWGLCFSKVITK